MTSTNNSLPSDLDPYSYTARRLQHANPEHLHLTSRRCFIGPIPEGWLQSHRKEWYKHHLHIHYSSRVSAFAAGPNVSKQRRLTGIDGPSVAATHSFRQPDDVDDEEGEVADGKDVEFTNEEAWDVRAQQTAEQVEQLIKQHIEGEDAPAAASDDLPPAVDIPRAGSMSDVGGRNKRRQSGNQDAQRGEERRSSEDTIKPPPRPPTKRDSSISTIKPSPESSSPSSQAEKPLRPLPQPSDSSDLESPIWLSPPTSRQPSCQSPLLRSRSSGKVSRSGSSASFVSANEFAAESPMRLDPVAEGEHSSNGSSFADRDPFQRQSYNSQSNRFSYNSQGALSPLEPLISRTESNTSLIHHGPPEPSPKLDGTADQRPTGRNRKQSRSQSQSQGQSQPEAGVSADGKSSKSKPRSATGLVRFDVPPDEDTRRRVVKVKLAQMKKRGTFKRAGRGRGHAGQIIKMENMLVRVEFTVHKVPDDFTEKDSDKIETTTIERWKEFMCVCRENNDEDCPYVLQFYKSRVIPAVEKTKVTKRWTHEIQLRKSDCQVNLFSSLDKSMVVWHPCRRGSLIYTLQSRSGASSMEWYTFLQNVFGWNRSDTLQINVPDLDVNLRIEKPFEALESSRDRAQEAEDDEMAVFRTMQEEQAATARIIGHCMEMLNQSPDWESVIKQWQGKHKMGLAWKRYDRLEWVHGANEQKMYGTMGMERSHELELRPKQHYPTEVPDKLRKIMQEPPPIEGFLIRLTSQKGANQKFGKLFFKRLYFSTHNQFLIFNRPARADPPPPPRLPMTEEGQVPSADRIADKIPLIYAVNPFPIHESSIDWLTLRGHSLAANSTPHTHDIDAFDENQRKLGLLRNCDGLINICNIIAVRNIQRGASPADDRVDSGTDVAYHQPVADSMQDDGATKQVDDDRIFELVLKNDLVIRLQAYSKTTKTEWMTRLRDLITYWKLRTTADINLYKAVRAENAHRLKIDETTEALVGQFANKWEVSNSAASPELYNMCNIACCRSVSMSGHLYHKGRQYGPFTRMLCIMSHGKLLMFADAVRSKDGKVLKHIHHERVGTLDLKECYVYSGLATADNNLYTGGTSAFDRAKPGRHGLPRIWLDDGWSSSDGDTSTCFVIWHGKKSGWFRSQDDPITQHQRGNDGKNKTTRAGPGKEGGSKTLQRYRRVKKLGKEGKSMVFRARSRAERDHWVLGVGMEIERLQTGEEVRLMGEDVTK